jgi:hypothetical protein
MVRFAQLNLMDPWPMRPVRPDLLPERDDVLRQGNAAALVDRFWQMLVPGGYFFGGPLGELRRPRAPLPVRAARRLLQAGMSTVSRAAESTVPARLLVVGMGELVVSADEGVTLVTYALGSCLGVAVYDPVARVGGMLHAMLPSSEVDPARAAALPALFVDTGVPELFRACYSRWAPARSGCS